MKKILFCAGLMAFVTSCTQDELLNDSIAEQAKGISFDAVVSDIVESRGTLYENNSKYPFFWHAETDKISVFAKGNVANAGDKGVVTTTTKVGETTNKAWTLTPGAVSYKATKSLGNGQFTSVSDADLLTWDDTGLAADKKPEATFVAAYGATISNVTEDKDGKVIQIQMTNTLGNAVQDYTSGGNVADYAPMYSVSTGDRSEKFNSVGERAELKFFRPLAVARFKSEGINEDYKEMFGKLQSITVTTHGYTPETGAPVTASPIVYAASQTITVDMANKIDPAKTNVALLSGTEVVANYNEEFGDGDVVFAALANVDRKANYKDKGIEEKVVIVYEFENIDFTQTIYTDANWYSDENSVLGVPQLKMTDYPFFVVGGSQLIVNSGEFAKVVKNGMVDWGTTGIDYTAITRIDSHVALTPAEQALLQNFTNLEELNLTAQTSLVKDALKNLSKLEEVRMPLVTTIDKEFTNVTFSALNWLEMGSYPFNEDLAINNKLVASTLKYMDASGVTSMVPEYGKDDMLSFNGLTVLDSIKVNNLTLNSNAFKGCVQLEKVIGTVNITGAEYAFDGCQQLETVNISGTDIPKGAFNGCIALENVLQNGVQVAPTTVGNEAFSGATALTIMDLKNTTMIGTSAFENSGLTYASATKSGETVTYDNNIVVGAETVAANAFAGTNVIRMNFTNVTELNPGIFANTSSLIQVKFDKAFTAAAIESDTNPWGGTFGTNPSNIVLFVNSSQEDVNGIALELPWTDISGATPVEKIQTINFKQIMK